MRDRMFYSIPKLIDCNARSKIIRSSNKLLIVGRCVEVEHGKVLTLFKDSGYVMLSVCLEEEHINMVGFKLAGILRRCRDFLEEVAVLTVDGSPHCVQLHFMVEEAFKVTGLEGDIRRKHFVTVKGEGVVEVPKESVKVARYLSKVSKLIKQCKG